MFGTNESEYDGATDVLLDLVASAKNHLGGGKPFLPIRSHFLVRGDGISQICIKCGTIAPEGQARCPSEGCGGLAFELIFDRNCGGTFVKLWAESDRGADFYWNPSVGAKPRIPSKSELGNLIKSHPNREQNSEGHDLFIGFHARVLDSNEDGATHHICPHSGASGERREANIWRQVGLVESSLAAI